MKKLVLSELESLELQRDGAVEITRNGFDILVEIDRGFGGGDFIITVVCPYDKVVVK
jgi:hypothetical protein